MWIGICIAIFSGFGNPLSIVIENLGFIGIGPVLVVASYFINNKLTPK